MLYIFLGNQRPIAWSATCLWHSSGWESSLINKLNSSISISVPSDAQNYFDISSIFSPKFLSMKQKGKIIACYSRLPCIRSMVVQTLKHVKYFKHSYKQSVTVAFRPRSKIGKMDLSFLLERNVLMRGGEVFPPLPRYQWNIYPCSLVPRAERNKQLCSTSVSNILKELGAGGGRGMTWRCPLLLSTFCKLSQLKLQFWLSYHSKNHPKIPW